MPTQGDSGNGEWRSGAGKFGKQVTGREARHAAAARAVVEELDPPRGGRPLHYRLPRSARHQCGLILVTRDHIPDTLREHIVSAEQAVGRADVSGLGHHRHSRFWAQLAARDCVVAL